MKKTPINFLKKQNSLIAIDIGASGVRVLESEFHGDCIEILNFAYASFVEDIFQNQLLINQEVVANKLLKIFQEKKIASNDVVTAVSGPAAFSKKITVAKMDNLEDLDSNIRFESNSLIPHGLDGVCFDYSLLNTNNSNNNIDVFITAVKQDIVASIQNTLSSANLNLKILDIDYLALLNLFEFNYPELKEKTVALIDIGGRYSTINICFNGEMLFSSNIPIGGRLIAEDLSKAYNTKIFEKDLSNISDIKLEKQNSLTLSQISLEDALEKQIEKIANDLKKQLTYYWESGTPDSIEKIFITGGGVYWPNINNIFSKRFNIECETFDPLKKVKIKNTPEKDDILKRSQQLAVLLGLSLRKTGDSKKRYKTK